MDIRFDNKNVVVTGASMGIGRATAIEFARSGASVIVNYFHSAEAAEQVVAQIEKEGGKAFCVKADVSNAEGVDGLFKKVRNIFNDKVDILINNAGSLLERTPIMEVSEALWDECIDLNVKSVFMCCQAFVPMMKKNNYGRIINISSIAARNGGGTGATHYSTSKAAVSTFTKGLAKELADTGITVNNVAPGIIATPFHDKFTSDETREYFKKIIPLGREGTAEEVAYSILFLASDYAAYILGETLEINGGLLMD
jgi:3-oxoacyl-[acyl-carrier protein] reductase